MVIDLLKNCSVFNFFRNRVNANKVEELYAAGKEKIYYLGSGANR